MVCFQATGLAPLNLFRKHSQGKGGSHRKYTILVQQGHLVIYSLWTELPSPNTNTKKNHKTHRILVELQDSLRSESIDSKAIIPNRPHACQMERFFFSKDIHQNDFVSICVLTELFLWLCTQFPIKESPKVLSEREREMNKGLLHFITGGKKSFLQKDLKGRGSFHVNR